MSAQASTQTAAPTLTSERLILRAFSLGDATTVQSLAGDHEIAATTAMIPHPYPDGAAEDWILTHDEQFTSGSGVTWAVTLRDTGQLIGAIGIIIDASCGRAEMGYWVGASYWGRGYITEAGRLVLRYAFINRNLNRIYAHHFHTNPASGRVMEKLGMKREGVLRQHYKKWGEYMDCIYYGILREEHKWREQDES